MSSETPKVSTLMSLATNESLIGRTLVVLALAGADAYPAGATLHGTIEEIAIYDNQDARSLLAIRVKQLEMRTFEDYRHPTWVTVPKGEHHSFIIDDRSASASYLRNGVVGINYPHNWHGTIELPEEDLPNT